jgi:hypothetical protein
MRRLALQKKWLVSISADRYWLVDRHTGCEVPETLFQNIGVREFNNYFDVNKGDWDVEFETRDDHDHFLASLFVEAGRLEDLKEMDPKWDLWHKEKCAFGTCGSPFLDPRDQRVTTAEGELDLLEQIKRNTISPDSFIRAGVTDADEAQGLYKKLIAGLPGKTKHLEALEEYYRQKIKKFSWKPETLGLNYNVSTRMPKENIVYPVRGDSFKAAQKDGLIFSMWIFAFIVLLLFYPITGYTLFRN